MGLLKCIKTKIANLEILKRWFNKYGENSFNVQNNCRCGYSQAGEDRIVKFLLADKKINLENLSYLDVGTNYPVDDNNTYLFYKYGARGVCVEANEALIPSIRKVRPKDKVLNVGVSADESTIADFYVFDICGHNTFDKEEAKKKELCGNILKVVKVPLININELISANFETFPDFLSLDIEGLDLKVLKSLDFSKYPIPIICVETCEFSEMHVRPKDNSIGEFLLMQNYEVYADTYINTIFVNKDWFYGK